MQVDVATLQNLVSERLISCQEHPKNNQMLIFNYTPKCQYNRENWNEYTMMCRGLITDRQGYIISRPFPKFFNLSEHTEESSSLPKINWNQNFEVTEKLDGSLGISYQIDGKWALATRGSFTSEQAEKGTQMLQELKTESMNEQFTYLFEIIFPENRIVVDYKGKEKLVLLAVVETDSGEELPWTDVAKEAKKIGCESAEYHALSIESIQRFEEYYGHAWKNSEGVVVRFADGTRVKVKLEEYVRLHKILTGINKVHIWERLMHDRGFDDVLELVPDEFMDWVRDTIKELTEKFDEIFHEANVIFIKAKEKFGTDSRKDYAMFFTSKENVKYSPILFKMLDDKPYDRTIWKMIKPEASPPFHQDIDG